MHYFDDTTDLLPASPSRNAGHLLLDGGESGEPRSLRKSRPEAEALRRNGAGPRGPRRRPGLLDGMLPAGPAASQPVSAMDRQMRRAGTRPARVPGKPASVQALKAWGVPSARPGADRRPDHRPYRRVADGLAITPRVSVIVPVMNEAKNLPGVFATIPAWVDEIVLVDGRSTDNTIEVARELRPDVRVVLQGGVGKGDALVAGFTAATGEIVVAIDGDGSTDGAEIVRFVSALMAGADFAKGSRFGSAGDSDDITPIRRFGNKMLNLMVNGLFKTSFTDLCYGYNAFWARHLGSMSLDSPGFEVETLMSIRAAEAGLRIYEIPSHERLRQHGVSNLSAVKDGWRILRLIITEKRAAMRRRSQQKKAAKRRKASKPKPFMAPGHLFHHAGAHDAPQAAVAPPAETGHALVRVVNGSAGHVR